MKKSAALIAVCLLVTVYSPFQAKLHSIETEVATTVMAQLTVNAPTSTATTSSTIKKSPSSTKTSKSLLGSYSNPARIGDTVKRDEEILKKETMAVTVLEVRKGNDANDLAKSTLGELAYETPIEGQEYIAVRVKIEVLKAPLYNVYRLYSYFHFTLRYTKDGDDVWSVKTPKKEAEGYPPLTGKTWVFFLIRRDSKPLLYFQPHLILNGPLDNRTSGAYFSLAQP